jgi:hypothetical protein
MSVSFTFCVSFFGVSVTMIPPVGLENWSPAFYAICFHSLYYKLCSEWYERLIVMASADESKYTATNNAFDTRIKCLHLQHAMHLGCPTLYCRSPRSSLSVCSLGEVHRPRRPS